MNPPGTDYFQNWALGTRIGDPYVERVSALRAACESWRDTPFRARSLAKGAGGGVDCAGFVGACYAEIGAIPSAVAVPPYAINHADHSEESVLRNWFENPEARRHVRRVEHDEPHLDGDMVFPVVGRTEHHLGIRIGSLIYHIARPAGWCVMSIAQLKFHPSRYRLTETRS